MAQSAKDVTENPKTRPVAEKSSRRKDAAAKLYVQSSIPDNWRKLLDRLADPRVTTIKQAAELEGVKVNTASQWLLRARMLQWKTKSINDEFAVYRLAYRKQGKKFLEGLD